METKIAALGFFRRLWQKLFRRVEDAYVLRQPAAATSTSASHTRNNGLVEAVDISASTSLTSLNGLDGKEGHHESCLPAESTAMCTTSCSVDTGFLAAAARATDLRPLSDIKNSSLSDGTCPVVPFYSVNTDPLDLQLVVDGDRRRESSEGCDSGLAALVARFDTTAENPWNEEPCFVSIFWQRPLFLAETPEPRPQQCVMGVPVRLDPAVVCDLDTGPFDRPCYESVFYTEVSNK